MVKTATKSTIFKFHCYTKKRPHKVIPSDNSMHTGNEQLFDRWGEFFTTKIENTHGTSADIGCSLVAVWLHFRGGYRGKHQEYIWHCGSTQHHDTFTSVNVLHVLITFYFAPLMFLGHQAFYIITISSTLT